MTSRDFIDPPSPETRPIEHARALNQQAKALSDQGRTQEALRIWEQIVDVYGEQTDPALAPEVAAALVAKGTALERSDQVDEALEAFRAARRHLSRQEVRDNSDWPSQLLAFALLREGFLLGRLSRAEEAIVAYEELVSRFRDHIDPTVSQYVSDALLSEAYWVAIAGDYERPMALYHKVIKRTRDSSCPRERAALVRALVNSGSTLKLLGRYDEAMLSFDEALETLKVTATDHGLEDELSATLFNRAVILKEWGRRSEAAAAFHDVAEQFASARDVEIQSRVVWAISSEASLLDEMDDPEAAILRFDDAVDLFGSSTDPRVEIHVAWALTNKGVVLSELSRHDEAVTTFSDCVLRYAHVDNASTLEAVARALLYKAMALDELGLESAANDVCQELKERFAGNPQPAIRTVLDEARDFRRRQSD